jgi:hypothetical protein
MEDIRKKKWNKRRNKGRNKGRRTRNSQFRRDNLVGMLDAAQNRTRSWTCPVMSCRTWNLAKFPANLTTSSCFSVSTVKIMKAFWQQDDKTLLVTALPVPTRPHWWHVAVRNCWGFKLLPQIRTSIFFWRRQYTCIKVWLPTAVKIHTAVFRIMTICILVCEHQIFWKSS